MFHWFLIVLGALQTLLDAGQAPTRLCLPASRAPSKNPFVHYHSDCLLGHPLDPEIHSGSHYLPCDGRHLRIMSKLALGPPISLGPNNVLFGGDPLLNQSAAAWSRIEGRLVLLPCLGLRKRKPNSWRERLWLREGLSLLIVHHFQHDPTWSLRHLHLRLLDWEAGTVPMSPSWPKGGPELASLHSSSRTWITLKWLRVSHFQLSTVEQNKTRATLQTEGQLLGLTNSGLCGP